MCTLPEKDAASVDVPCCFVPVDGMLCGKLNVVAY
jgi:hypothetical protein